LKSGPSKITEYDAKQVERKKETSMTKRTLYSWRKAILGLALPGALLSSLLIVSAAFAAVPNIPPAMLAQLKNMSPAEQAALARQYGIELPGRGEMGSALEDSPVGKPGEELDTFERVQRRQLERALKERLLIKEEEKNGKEELKRFGLDLFDREISTFSPVDDLPPPDGYRIGPGDSVNVYLYGNENSELVLPVSREGQLIIPRLGPIAVAGLTFSEVVELIKAKVAAQLVGTEVLVSMGKLRAINVFLAGDVYAPGSYSVSGLATVLQVLYAGGGVNEIGSLRNIQVKRRGEIVGRLDAYDVLLRGDTSGDMRLASGDTVFVPTVDRLVALDGEVKRPAVYEILPSDTLGDALAMAGGLTASGYRESASIQRMGAGQASKTRIQVDLSNRQDLAMPLFDGDSLVVAEIKDEVTNDVSLRGALARPGGYAWTAGQRVSDLIKSLDDDLLAETDLSTGLVVRRTGDGLDIEVLSLNLGAALENKGSEADVLLQPKDEVLVFALPYLNESYQKLIEAREEADNSSELSVPKLEFEEASDGEFVLAEGLMSTVRKNRDSDAKKGNERPFEDRSELIEEVVFRLQAQAKTPSTTRVVEITGDVRLPGYYPLLADQELSSLVALAGGYENSAYLESAEVTRLDFTASGSARISSFKVSLMQSAKEQGFQLEPLDQVRISRIPNWSLGDTVQLTGAVVFPGEYPIVAGESLASVMSRAGGVAEEGFPEGAVLVKVEAKKREQAQLERLIASIQRNVLAQSQTRESEENIGAASAKEDLEFLETVLQSEVSGRVIIDLPAILAGDASADIQLEAGDSLFVPDFNNTVSVIGEVRQPGTFHFEGDRSVADYLDLAAGVTVRADDQETYVVRANGSVDRIRRKKSLLSFSPSSLSVLQPGDTIIVPVDEEYQPVLARYKEISTVVFQSIASLYPLFRL